LNSFKKKSKLLHQKIKEGNFSEKELNHKFEQLRNQNTQFELENKRIEAEIQKNE
jgi:hypothetical protein